MFACLLAHNLHLQTHIEDFPWSRVCAKTLCLQEFHSLVMEGAIHINNYSAV